MKTAERILVTSLALFNQHGEPNVTSVDIAMELDISPGNLYYHFKGKEIIVSALFELYQKQMTQLLNASIGRELSVEEFFYYVYLILEKIHLFQFFYRSPADLADKYPDIHKGFVKLIATQEAVIERQIRQFADNQQFNAGAAQQSQLVEVFSLVFSQSTNFYMLKGIDESHQVYRSLAMILAACLPYLSIDSEELLNLQAAVAEHAMGGLVDDSVRQALQEN
ncbi:TetR/AcrR family transcriptional regulator [Aestuariibacter salexigens]|uniref:TetR/AcrR family transcriptional regulator n=1 Tax=Aestuariibacter salexigens TaxID=226010 RepID=UPI00041DD39E|nr:TetR/AcrR family transcriptional regulator [Aestuariibacter salexigens]